MFGCNIEAASNRLACRDPAPEVPTTIAPYTICDSDYDGVAQFDLTTMQGRESEHITAKVSTSPSPIPDVYSKEPIFISYKVSPNETAKTTNKTDEINAQLTAKYLNKPWQISINNIAINNKEINSKAIRSKTKQSNNLSIKAPNFTNHHGQSNGKKNDVQVSNNVKANQTSIPALATLWARRKIDDHYRKLMLDKDKNAKQQIIDLALNFNLVTPFTSLVAVEKNISRPSHRQAKNKQLKNNLPANQAMPKTALNWQFQLLICAALFVLAACLYFCACWSNRQQPC